MNYGFVLASIHLAVGGLILILGLVLLRQNLRSRLNRIVAVMLFFVGLGATIGSSDFLIPQVDPKLSAEGLRLLNDFSYLWEFFFPFLLLFVLEFPTPHPSVRRFPFLRWLIFVPYVGHMVLVATHTMVGDTFGVPTGENAAAFWSLPRAVLPLIYGFHRSLFSVVNLAMIILSLWMIRHRLRRIDREQLREQLSTIGWGMTIAAILYLSAVVLPVGEGGVAGAPTMIRQTLLLLSLMVAGGSIAVAMVRHRFLDATVIARRAILYAVSTAVVLGLYLTVIQQVDELIQRATGFETPVFQGLMLVLALVLYQPLLARTEEWLENFLLRERTDYRAALRELSEGLVTRLDAHEQAEMVVDLLTDVLVSDSISLVRIDASGARVEASRGLRIEADVLLAELPTGAELAEMEVLAPLAVDDTRLFLIPLRHRGEVLGVLILGEKSTGSRYTREDETLLSSIANQASVALRNAELHEQAMRQAELERDIENARRIQQTFLPTSFPHWEGIDIFGHNIPSREVGGDYYDVVSNGRDEVFLAVADVSGKGMPAALLASMLQASLRTLVATEASPARIAHRLNSLVCESTSVEQFATFFVARFDLGDRRLTYANAGHAFPIVLSGNGRTRLLDHSDLLLGFIPTTHYEERTDLLEPGEKLVLFTDGISEAPLRAVGERPADILGEDGFLEMLKELGPVASACEMVNQVQGRLDEIADLDEEGDDRTLLILHLEEGSRSGDARRVMAEVHTTSSGGDPVSGLSPSPEGPVSTKDPDRTDRFS